MIKHQKVCFKKIVTPRTCSLVTSTNVHTFFGIVGTGRPTLKIIFWLRKSHKPSHKFVKKDLDTQNFALFSEVRLRGLEGGGDL